jgi:hypothetical protein
VSHLGFSKFPLEPRLLGLRRIEVPRSLPLDGELEFFQLSKMLSLLFSCTRLTPSLQLFEAVPQVDRVRAARRWQRLYL